MESTAQAVRPKGQTVKTQSSPRDVKNSLLSKLGNLFTGDHINASGGVQYLHKNFGRDSAISALFILDMLKNTNDAQNQREGHYVLEQVTRSLVHWQGQKSAKTGGHWRKNAEEPGKIHHEAGPIKIDDIALARNWQEADDQDSDVLVYYGSVDSTPLFVRLVSEYVGYLRGDDATGKRAYHLLMSRVQNYRGVEVTVAEAVSQAVTWICVQLLSSELGLLEYQRRPGQERGMPNQTWKDSLTSYVHLNGQLVNTNRPVASIEIQALAYDALLNAAELFENDVLLANAARISPTQTKNWRLQATRLRSSLIEHFWLADQKRFVQALDRHPKSGHLRAVETPSSNELHLLNSRLFDELDDQTKQVYLESLVRQATSDDFLTDLGIRCRARSQYKLINFADYHGSWAVWPWESHWIAMGLRRQGFTKLADEVDRRISNAFTVSGGYLEYFLVDPRDNSAFYRFVPLDWGLVPQRRTSAIAATNMPDAPQAWSLTAAIDIEAVSYTVQRVRQSDNNLWLAGLEKEILLQIEHAPLITDASQISRLRETSQAAIIDRMGGWLADERYHRMAGTPTPVLLPAV